MQLSRRVSILVRRPRAPFFQARAAQSSTSPFPSGSPAKVPAADARPATSSDLIEQWNPTVFRTVGAAAAVGSLVVGYTVGPLTGAIAAIATAAYWKVGLDDLRQTKHTILRNFPVLGHARYILEGIRPG